VRFTVPGPPVAKARPRAARVGDGVRIYTPTKSARFEERVMLCAQAAGITKISGPVMLRVTFWFPMKGQPRQRNPRPAARKDTKPDLDNLLKSVCDGIPWEKGDQQVACIQATKQHCAQRDAEGPRTEVEIQCLS